MTEINSTSILGSREIYTSLRYPISKDILFRKINTGEFPKPMKAGNSFFWLKTDVEAFFEMDAEQDPSFEFTPNTTLEQVQLEVRTGMIKVAYSQGHKALNDILYNVLGKPFHPLVNMDEIDCIQTLQRQKPWLDLDKIECIHILESGKLQ